MLVSVHIFIKEIYVTMLRTSLDNIFVLKLYQVRTVNSAARVTLIIVCKMSCIYQFNEIPIYYIVGYLCL